MIFYLKNIFFSVAITKHESQQLAELFPFFIETMAFYFFTQFFELGRLRVKNIPNRKLWSAGLRGQARIRVRRDPGPDPRDSITKRAFPKSSLLSMTEII